jgi:hypothetical protein
MWLGIMIHDIDFDDINFDDIEYTTITMVNVGWIMLQC